MAYSFPLSIQLLLPQDYRRDEGFRQNLAVYDLVMTAFATGASAIEEGLSLSDADETVRRRSVHRCAEYIEFASSLNAGVIVGYLKGGVSADMSASVSHDHCPCRRRRNGREYRLLGHGGRQGRQDLPLHPRR